MTGYLSSFGEDASGELYVLTLAGTVERIVAAWVRFARAGDPNGEGLPAWPAYAAEADEHLELGDQVRVAAGLRRKECDALSAAWEALRRPAKKFY